MALSKHRISTPLEAGTSILDTHNLPTHLNDALEYISYRLARKSLHITLIAIRREYQTPSVLPVCTTPVFSPPASPAPSISSRLGFAASLKQRLLRPSAHPVLSPLSLPAYSNDDLRSATASPTFSISSESSGYASSSSSKPSWPCTPATPATPMSIPPMTPCSTSSFFTESGPMSPSPFGIRLVHGDVTCPKIEQIVRHIIEKARRRFGIGTDWLPSVSHASTYNLTDSIIRRSLIQNDILFASSGLTLCSLDRLYTFKAALSNYSRTRSPLILEDAVDELRRLFLSNAGRKVSRADVLRSYDWLSVTDSALNDVDRMYRRAYGGPDGRGAIEGMRSSLVDEIRFEIEDVVDDVVHVAVAEDEAVEPLPLLFRPSPMSTPTPTGPKMPLLRLQTNFDARGKLSPGGTVAAATTTAAAAAADEEEEEELTARPERQNTMHLWPAAGTIDEVLRDTRMSAMSGMTGMTSMSRASDMSRLGPMTPNGYDDISPITRGEWGFLFTDARFGAKKGGVETC